MLSANLVPKFMRLVIVGFALAVLGMAASASAATADDIKEASKLYQQGKLDAALTKVNGALVAQPKDAQGRFLKGLIFTEQKKVNDAIQIFTGLTEDYPELPEPYNNLAVLYASQGNYDKAKAALELAIHTHPAYATAHENLGDIYAQLARRAYDKALQLDKNNTTAQSKLAMIKDLFSSPKTTGAAAPSTAAVEPAKATPVVVAKADPPKATEPVKAAPAKTEPAKAPPSAKPAADGADAAVSAAVEAWAKAWASRNVASYLACYAPEFQPPEGLTRAAWEEQRKVRIEAASTISVAVGNIRVTVRGDKATAVFRQTYKSDKVSSRNTKTLQFIRSGDKWLIQSERAG